MPVTVETGAIVAGANSYVSRTEADAYHLERGRETTWVDLDDEIKDQLLIRSTQSMEARYRTVWKGKKRNDSETVTPQPLAWPRKDVTDEDGVDVDDQTIPVLVKQAQMEIALLMAQGSEFIKAEVTGSNIQSETVGPISTTYFKDAMVSSTFPFIDQMLEPLTGGASTVKLGGHIQLTDSEEADMQMEDPDYYDLTSPYWQKWFDL